MSYVGSVEVREESVGYTQHSGDRDGWQFVTLWEPGMGHAKLVLVLERMMREGMEARTKEIGRLLGVGTK